MAGNKNESADATTEIKNMHKKDLVWGLGEYLGAKCSTILNFKESLKLIFFLFCPEESFSIELFQKSGDFCG